MVSFTKMKKKNALKLQTAVVCALCVCVGLGGVALAGAFGGDEGQSVAAESGSLRGVAADEDATDAANAIFAVDRGAYGVSNASLALTRVALDVSGAGPAIGGSALAMKSAALGVSGAGPAVGGSDLAMNNVASGVLNTLNTNLALTNAALGVSGANPATGGSASVVVNMDPTANGAVASGISGTGVIVDNRAVEKDNACFQAVTVKKESKKASMKASKKKSD
jgi:hypothetical protein